MMAGLTAGVAVRLVNVWCVALVVSCCSWVARASSSKAVLTCLAWQWDLELPTQLHTLDPNPPTLGTFKPPNVLLKGS